jgi:hypothetical protein
MGHLSRVRIHSQMKAISRAEYPYTLIPSFRESAAYGELRQDISPCWFVAARDGYTSNNVTATLHSIESGIAFRPNRYELIKIAYEEQHHQDGDGAPIHTLGIQFVTSLHRILVVAKRDLVAVT